MYGYVAATHQLIALHFGQSINLCAAGNKIPRPHELKMSPAVFPYERTFACVRFASSQCYKSAIELAGYNCPAT